jgi:leucyl aminopeptidase
MKITSADKKLFEIDADIYVVPVIKGLNKQFSEGVYSPLGAKINSLVGSGSIDPGYRKKSVYTFEVKGSLKKIFFIGLGEAEKLNFEKLREAAGFSLKEIKSLGAKTCASLAFLKSSADFKAQLEGFVLADYIYTEFKTGKKEPQLSAVTFASNGLNLDKVIKEVGIVTDAVFFAKDLMNGPSNYTTPARIALAAKDSAKLSKKTSIKVYELDEIKKMGMGAFYSVAKGSDEPAKFIVARYSGAAPSKKPVVFVGKGITFDTGGISLKPQSSAMSAIEDMKFDMSGAASVIALLRIVSAMALKVNAVFIAPVTENMPSGKAYKPGDVLKTLSGKTVEVISTDAEGRLILCDALTYALRYKPALIVDIATLTGACVMALGHYATGMMGTDSAAMQLMSKAGDETGERVWELPMLEEYAESLKSKYADIKNIGEGGAGTAIAGLFLKEFTGGCPWVHLDIAGTAYGIKNKPYIPDGTAATGVRLMYEFIKKYISGGL